MRTQTSTSNESIDPDAVRRYFEGVGDQATAASSMAHLRNVPPAANLYRKQSELTTLQDWLDAVPATARVLDVGCGAGNWTALFAARYRRVVAIDQSMAMVASARHQLAGANNVNFIFGDLRTALPAEQFELIFVGGVCMYLNDDELETLLRSLCSRLTSHGIVILRESTVRSGRRVAHGEYQAIYRTVEDYRRLCERAGARVEEVRLNRGYESFEIGADIAGLPQRFFQGAMSPRLGAAIWYVLNAAPALSFGLLPRLMTRLGIDWPQLQNHFFRVGDRAQD
jgi:SAM-dependent methyltransferase